MYKFVSFTFGATEVPGFLCLACAGEINWNLKKQHIPPFPHHHSHHHPDCVINHKKND